MSIYKRWLKRVNPSWYTQWTKKYIQIYLPLYLMIVAIIFTYNVANGKTEVGNKLCADVTNLASSFPARFAEQAEVTKNLQTFAPALFGNLVVIQNTDTASRFVETYPPYSTVSEKNSELLSHLWVTDYRQKEQPYIIRNRPFGPNQAPQNVTLSQQSSIFSADYLLICRQTPPERTIEISVASTATHFWGHVFAQSLFPLFLTFIVSIIGTFALLNRLRKKEENNNKAIVQAIQYIEQGNYDKRIAVDSTEQEFKLLLQRVQDALRQKSAETQHHVNASKAVTDLDKDDAMQNLLEAMVHVSSADCARAIVMKSIGGRPDRHKYGDDIEKMRIIDKRLYQYIAKNHREVILRTPEQIRSVLNIDPKHQIVVQSLIGFPLYTNGTDEDTRTIKGIAWIGSVEEQLYGNPTYLRTLRAFVNYIQIVGNNVSVASKLDQDYRYLLAVQNNITNGILLIDQQDRVLHINPVMEEIFNFQSEGTHYQITPTDENTALIDLIQLPIMEANGKELHLPNGNIYTVTVSEIDTEDEEIYSRLYTLQDITDRKRIQDYKHILMRGVVHDTKSPIASLALYLETMKYTLNTKAELTQLNNASLETERALRFLNKLQALTAIEAKPFVPNWEDAHLLILNEISDNQSASWDKNIRFELEPFNEIYSLYGDADSIRMCLNNLIGNAISFSPEHSVITVTVQVNNSYLLIGVHDQGPGLPVGEEETIFQAYRSIRTNNQGHDGLGLAVVNEVMKQHGGACWASNSSSGTGADFYISFPHWKSRPLEIAQHDN